MTCSKFRPRSLAEIVRSHPGVRFPAPQQQKAATPPPGYSNYHALAALTGRPVVHVRRALRGSRLKSILVQGTAYFQTATAIAHLKAHTCTAGLPEAPPVGFCTIAHALELSGYSRPAFSRRVTSGLIRSLPGAFRNKLGNRSFCKFYAISDILRNRKP